MDTPGIGTSARTWRAASIAVAALLLGAHVWRGSAPLREAVPDPLGEVAAASQPLGASTIASTIFVPDCATALVVRFDPASMGQGEVAVSLLLQQRGNRFTEAPVFQATARLESMRDGVWTLHPPMDTLRARFVRIELHAAAGARGSVLLRAPRRPGQARQNLDERWMPRASLIAGVQTPSPDPLACIASDEPMSRALGIPSLAFLGTVAMLTLVVAGRWLWVG